MPKKLVTVVPGEIHAIPLFVTDKAELTRFSKKDWDVPNAAFSFMRVIEDQSGAGIIIEVLDLVGPLSIDLAQVCAANRLFRPIVISGLEIYKKRWPFLGAQPRYDREKHSIYSQICLVLSPTDGPVLWKGGQESPISLQEAKEYEPWTIWRPIQVERRINAALGRDGEREK